MAPIFVRIWAMFRRLVSFGLCLTVPWVYGPGLNGLLNLFPLSDWADGRMISWWPYPYLDMRLDSPVLKTHFNSFFFSSSEQTLGSFLPPLSTKHCFSTRNNQKYACLSIYYSFLHLSAGKFSSRKWLIFLNLLTSFRLLFFTKIQIFFILADQITLL